jgi:hypothetical protein
VKDDDSDCADSHNFLNRWKNYSCQLLNVQWVSDVSQIEIDAAGPLVFDTNLSEFETVIANLKKC